MKRCVLYILTVVLLLMLVVGCASDPKSTVSESDILNLSAC